MKVLESDICFGYFLECENASFRDGSSASILIRINDISAVRRSYDGRSSVLVGNEWIFVREKYDEIAKMLGIKLLSS